MVNFADCVSKVQCRNLVTNTPTKNGIRTLLNATISVNKNSSNVFGMPTLSQYQIMNSMGAKQKGWVQKFYDKYGFRSGAKAEQELLRYMKSSKFEPCGIPVGTKEIFNNRFIIGSGEAVKKTPMTQQELEAGMEGLFSIVKVKDLKNDLLNGHINVSTFLQEIKQIMGKYSSKT